MPCFGMRRTGPAAAMDAASPAAGVLGRWKYRALEQRGSDAPLSAADSTKLLEEINGFMREFPGSRALSRVRLDIVASSDALFVSMLREYIVKALQRASTTLIADLKSFYPPREVSMRAGGRLPLPAESAQFGKVEVLDSLLSELLEGLQSSPPVIKDKPKRLSITPAHVFLVSLWRGQHLDRWGASTDAEKVLREAVDHTSTSPDAYHALARCLKHQGALKEAAQHAATAAALDADDRYVNTKHAEYAARAGQVSVEEVREIVYKFVHGKEHQHTTLENCHIFWIYLALAQMAERRGPLRIALRCYADCLDFIRRLREDEMDFHHFTLRGGRLIHFERMMHWMDGLPEFQGA